MARVSRGFKARRRRKRVLKLSKGYRGTRSRNYRMAVHVVHRALAFSYRDRRTKKRDFRRLWITRINAAARQHGLKYSEFIHGLSLMGVEIDRCMLAHIAVNDPGAFAELAAQVRSELESSETKSTQAA